MRPGTDQLLPGCVATQSARPNLYFALTHSRAVDDLICPPVSTWCATARIIAAPHRCTLQPEPDLREIEYGRWQGRARDEVEREFAEVYEAWQEDPLTMAPTGGESGIQVLARALPVMRRIVVAHRRRSVLVVSHKGTNRLLISSLLGFNARGCRDRLDQSPAALTILDFATPVRARLHLFNHTSH